MISINRLVQIPVNNIEFSKNLVDITVQAETLEEAEEILNKGFNSQMQRFRESMEELKSSEDYDKMLKQAEFFKYLQTRPIYSAIAKEFKQYQSTNK